MGRQRRCGFASYLGRIFCEVGYIRKAFPIVKRKDEQKHGEYRTKRVILEIYDAMADAMKTGQPYRTILDPSAEVRDW